MMMKDVIGTRKALAAVGCTPAEIQRIIAQQITVARRAHKAEARVRREATESPEHRESRLARESRSAQRERAHQARIDYALTGSARPMVARNWLAEM